jgi:ATP-dependent DNA ligase
MSEGVIGDGTAYFNRAVEQGLEGIVAKRVDSPYLPGRRSEAWMKIKRHEEIPCVVVGYLTDERGQLRSLVIATQVDGTLRHVGQVGSGLTQALCDEILVRLKTLGRAESVVACDVRGRWVEPEIYCQVRYMERTKGGHLRAPVLVKML